MTEPLRQVLIAGSSVEFNNLVLGNFWSRGFVAHAAQTVPQLENLLRQCKGITHVILPCEEGEKDECTVLYVCTHHAPWRAVLGYLNYGNGQGPIEPEDNEELAPTNPLPVGDGTAG